MKKSMLRKKMIHTLNAMEAQVHLQNSLQIHKKLLLEENMITSEIIGITLSAFPEVETWSLIEELWKLGKRVAVPKCEPATRSMDFYEIDSFEQLEVVYMKLKEPIVSITEKLDAAQIDVMIVPGVVFDRNGYRVGFGGGYYDRYLSSYTGATIALAFDCQVVGNVPVEAYDLPVDCIVTESERIVCNDNDGVGK